LHASHEGGSSLSLFTSVSGSDSCRDVGHLGLENGARRCVVHVCGANLRAVEVEQDSESEPRADEIVVRQGHRKTSAGMIGFDNVRRPHRSARRGAGAHGGGACRR